MLGTKGLTDASRSPAHAGIAIFDGAFGHIQGDGHGKLGQAVVGVTDSGLSQILSSSPLVFMWPSIGATTCHRLSSFFNDL
jgi:hypothetical protein